MEKTCKKILTRCLSSLLVMAMLMGMTLSHFTIEVRAAGASVSIDSSNIPDKLYEGKEFILTAIIENLAEEDIKEDGKSWSVVSGDAAAIEIDSKSGKVSARGAGSVEVEYKVIPKEVTAEPITDRVAFTVAGKPEISIKNPEGEKKAGDEFTLQYETKNMVDGGLTKVTWSATENSSIVSLNEETGAMKFLAAGTVKVKAQALYDDTTFASEEIEITAKYNEATIDLVINPETSTAEGEIEVIATVSGSAETPTGDVNFTISYTDAWGTLHNVDLDTVKLTGGSATSKKFTLKGKYDYRITANYTGDTMYLPAEGKKVFGSGSISKLGQPGAAKVDKADAKYEIEYAVPGKIEVSDVQSGLIDVSYADDQSKEIFEFEQEGLTIKITGLKEGTGKLVIKKAESPIFAPGTEDKEVEVTVKKSTLEIEEIVVKTKQYDGEKDTNAVFKVNENQLSAGDRAENKNSIEAAIDSAKVSYESVNVGKAKFKLTEAPEFTDEKWSDKYVLVYKSDIIVKDEFGPGGVAPEILPRDIAIKIENKNENKKIVYGSYDWNVYKDKLFVELAPDEAETYPGDMGGALDGTLVDIKRYQLKQPENSIGGVDVLFVGEHSIGLDGLIKYGWTDILGNNIYTKVEGNYNLIYNPAVADAILTIEPGKFSNEDVEFLSGVTTDKGKNWVNHHEPLTMDILQSSEKAQYYDAVFAQIGNDTIELTGDGLSYDDLKAYFIADPENKKQGLTINVYLKNTSDLSNATVTENTVEYVLLWDDAAPIVSATVEKDKPIVFQMLKNISFDYFQRSQFKAKIEIKDWADKEESAEGVGIKEWSYYVHKTYEDIEDAEQLLESIDESKWIEGGLQGLKLPITITEEVFIPANEGDEPGNFVIFVRTMDEAGNKHTVSSNGIIIENYDPVLNISLKDNDQKVVRENGIAATDVNVHVTANDSLKDTVSGLKAIKYKIIKNGDVNKPYDKAGNLLEDGWALLWPPESHSYDSKLDSYKNPQGSDNGEVMLDFTIPAELFESNNLEVHVSVEDNAGNSTADFVPFKIDKTAPQVTVEYTDTKAPLNSIYFKEPRKATVTVTDANFNKDTVLFKLKREKQDAQLYSLQGLRSQLGANAVSAQWIDSAAGSDKTYTKERTNQISITFAANDDYQFEIVNFTDQAGNKADLKNLQYKNKGAAFDKANKHFIVDRAKPVISVKYTADGIEVKPGTNNDSRAYKNKTITAHVTIKEHNFVLPGKKVDGEVSLSVSKANPKNGRKEPASADYTKVIKSGSWGNYGDDRTINLDFDVDANYDFKMTYTDLAGNKSTYNTHYFTVDKTNPTGTVTVGELGTWTKFLSKITFGLFSNKTQRVTVTGADITSPVTNVSYYKSNKVLARNQLENVKWTKGNTFNKAPEEQFIIYSKVTDKAANTDYFSSDGIILDTTKPGPGIEITAADPAHGIYDKNVPVNISVTDPVSGKTYAGLQSVSYEVLNGDKVTQSGNFDSALKPASKRVRKLSRDITVDAEKNNSNFVTVKVTAVDNAGNTAKTEKKMKIDITNPAISVSYNNDSPLNGQYYKDNRVATVTVTERNFDPNNVQFTITNTDGTQPDISGWSSSSDAGVSDSATHTCTVNFGSDGDYTFTLACTDLAGNKAAYDKTDSFTIDKTAPKIEVSYDNNDVQNQKYYKAVRRATVTITEHNFNAADVRTAITASLAGAEITAPTISGFSSSGNVHTATINYEADGDYTFNVSYQDQAGNAAGEYTQDAFTIDTAKPTIKLSGFEKANKNTVIPNITCDDINYNGESINIELVGVNHSDMKASYTADTGRKNFFINNFNRDKSEAMDDIYVLKAAVTDLAGNLEEVTSTFSVNRYGSVYTMDQATMKILESYYTNSPEDLVITETNTDTLEFLRITCSHDGEQMEMIEGQHYDLEESGDEDSWKVYTYRIHKDNFEADGKYVVTVYSEDRAANVSSTQTKNKSIEFVVDKTSPTIVITGVENGAQYRTNSKAVTIDGKDNIYLKSMKMEVQIDGKTERVQEFTEEQLSEDYGVVKEAVLQANQWQTLRISAEDMAGNIHTAEDIRVLVTPNLLIQFYMNKPLFIGSILILLLIAAGIIILIRKRRKSAE